MASWGLGRTFPCRAVKAGWPVSEKEWETEKRKIIPPVGFGRLKGRSGEKKRPKWGSRNCCMEEGERKTESSHGRLVGYRPQGNWIVEGRDTPDTGGKDGLGEIGPGRSGTAIPRRGKSRSKKAAPVGRPVKGQGGRGFPRRNLNFGKQRYGVKMRYWDEVGLKAKPTSH